VLRSLIHLSRESTISHAHISRHATDAHAVDLPLTEADWPTYGPYIDLLVDSQFQRSAHPLSSRAISLELEGYSKMTQVVGQYRLLQAWIRRSERRYDAFRWLRLPNEPTGNRIAVLVADLIGSTTILESFGNTLPGLLSEVICEAQTIVSDFGGVYDKFTGDGFIALWFCLRTTASARA